MEGEEKIRLAFICREMQCSVQREGVDVQVLRGSGGVKWGCRAKSGNLPHIFGHVRGKSPEEVKPRIFTHLTLERPVKQCEIN